MKRLRMMAALKHPIDSFDTPIGMLPQWCAQHCLGFPMRIHLHRAWRYMTCRGRTARGFRGCVADGSMCCWWGDVDFLLRRQQRNGICFPTSSDICGETLGQRKKNFRQSHHEPVRIGSVLSRFQPTVDLLPCLSRSFPHAVNDHISFFHRATRRL